MDVSFSNVLEGTRQYFLGLPKASPSQSSAPRDEAASAGQPFWPDAAAPPPPSEGALAQSGAPAMPDSRPPSVAAAHPPPPPRPPSEPLEPEPHIIHKATVMREALQKQREEELLDRERPPSEPALSPPSHIIHKPPRTLPAPAPVEPTPPPQPAPPLCPSPSRAPVASPYRLPPTAPTPPQARPPTPLARPVPTPEPHPRPQSYRQAYRPPSAPAARITADHYTRYTHESTAVDGRTPPSTGRSPQAYPRMSPHQTYARISAPAHQEGTQRQARMKEAAGEPNPSVQRYQPAAPPPNDRVPPILHPTQVAAPPSHPAPPSPHRHSTESRSAHAYSAAISRSQETYARLPSVYDRHPSTAQRKYEAHTYPSYPATVAARAPTLPTSSQPSRQYVEATHYAAATSSHANLNGTVLNQHYPPRPPDHARMPLSRADYASVPTQVDTVSKTTSRSSHQYAVSSSQSYSRTSISSGVGCAAPTPVGYQTPPIQQPQPQSPYRHAPPAKSAYDTIQQNVQTSPPRGGASKTGFASHQPRLTVSVTTLVNQMNQTKQKRESPLDLSVKTVKNSADSTAQDEAEVSSGTPAHTDLAKVQLVHARDNAFNYGVASRHPAASHFTSRGTASSHKVDFSPNFHSQYTDKTSTSRYSAEPIQAHHPSRAPPIAPHHYNGAYENTVKSHAPRPAPEPYIIDNRYQTNHKYLPKRIDHSLPRIDLTPAMGKEHQYREGRQEHRYAPEESRKRVNGPVVSNIPEKIVRYETWSADSRERANLSRLSQSAQEQHKLMSQPVYSYSSHKQFQAYQNEQRRSTYHNNSHYSTYPSDPTRHNPIYNPKPTPIEKYPNSRQIIQKVPSQLQADHSGVPADKRVLSILRNSLETKNMMEPAKPPSQISELIVIDDDPIEITDLTKDNEAAVREPRVQHYANQPPAHKLHMPRAVDSIRYDSDNSQKSNNFDEFMARQRKIDLEISTDSKNKSPENDVASRIRTKAELKGFTLPTASTAPVPQVEIKQEKVTEIDCSTPESVRLQPKSQKAHLFNQLYEENRAEEKVRLESVIKNEIGSPETELLPGIVKSEPMNIDEIEKDAVNPIGTDDVIISAPPGPSIFTEEEDLFWASTCESFVEQLKTGCTKKKARRKRADTTEHEVAPEKVTPVELNIYSEEANDKECVSKEKSDFELSSSEKVPHETNKGEKNENLVKEPVVAPLDIQTNIEKLPDVETNAEKENTSIVQKDKELSSLNEKPTSSEKTERKQSLEKNKNKWRSSDKKDKKPVAEQKLKRKSLDRKQGSAEPNDSKRKSLELREKKTNSLQDTLSKDHEDKEKKEKKCDTTNIVVKKEPMEEEIEESPVKETTPTKEQLEQIEKSVTVNIVDIIRSDKSGSILLDKIKKEVREKGEPESTDDDEPLIKSKLLKDKNKDFKNSNITPGPKSVFVKLECCNADANKNSKDNSDTKPKLKQKSKSKQKSSIAGDQKESKSKQIGDSSSPESDTDDLTVASRLRVRKSIKTEETKSKTSSKVSPSKSKAIEEKNAVKKPGFGDGSDFHPGWEQELYEYKRSLRMPSRLINMPKNWTRISTSLPDLDPSPVSPASSAAAGPGLDSDLESNSSCYKINYDSEASNSTIFSLSHKSTPKKNESILDLLIQKYGRKDDSKRKIKEDPKPKLIPKSANPIELLPTPSLGLTKTEYSNLTIKKEKMENGYYLGAFRKETVSSFRKAFIKDTNGHIGATEEFAPVVLKTRTRTESKVHKQRTIIKEVFGDERPASAPPSSCREEGLTLHGRDKDDREEIGSKPKPIKKICKLKQKSSSIRDGLRSTSLKKCDAKGRLLRLKKRNNYLKTLGNKKIKDLPGKHKKEIKPLEAKEPSMEGSKDKLSVDLEAPSTTTVTKKRFKRLFARRKFSSGFDYIRKKKKIIRKEEEGSRVRRIASSKPNPESVHDIQKEIKGWFINKSVGETQLHRAARLGYTDCVAYCLEKMDMEASARDNAGFTPLHVAAARGHLQIARLLLQYGANVSAAAQGGIRPLHEACENEHVEMIRLLLSFGADPLLATYAGQTPAALADGAAGKLLRQHIGDVQGTSVDPWHFPGPNYIFDPEENGYDPLCSPPSVSPPPPDSSVEIQCTDAPLPPFYSLKPAPGQPSEGLWCLLQDITSLLQIKSRDTLLKQIHSGGGSPRELLRELRTAEFLERAQCHQLLAAGERVNVRASKVALVRVTDKLRQLLRVETVLLS